MQESHKTLNNQMHLLDYTYKNSKSTKRKVTSNWTTVHILNWSMQEIVFTTLRCQSTLLVQTNISKKIRHCVINACFIWRIRDILIIYQHISQTINSIFEMAFLVRFGRVLDHFNPCEILNYKFKDFVLDKVVIYLSIGDRLFSLHKNLCWRCKFYCLI